MGRAGEERGAKRGLLVMGGADLFPYLDLNDAEYHVDLNEADCRTALNRKDL
jgi:hypothetical protein